jgi:short subunit dehydrogenase-like uncharacterized protein
MILETALSMALQMDDIKQDPYAGQHAGGVLSPAAATGKVLLERLKHAGVCAAGSCSVCRGDVQLVMTWLCDS